MQRLRPVLSILFMVLAIIAAYELDRWTSSTAKLFPTDIGTQPLLAALVVSALLQVTIWAFLAW